MSPMFVVRTGFLPRMFFTAISCGAALCFALLSASFGQSTNPVPSEQVGAPAQQKSEDVTRAAPRTRHFDRVVVIVLENGDYETAIKDPNLAALAAQGASF